MELEALLKHPINLLNGTDPFGPLVSYSMNNEINQF